MEGRNLIREFIYKPLEVLRNFMSEVELHHFYKWLDYLKTNLCLLQMLCKTIPTFASFYSHLSCTVGDFPFRGSGSSQTSKLSKVRIVSGLYSIMSEGIECL